jgi:starch phosphorylase
MNDSRDNDASAETQASDALTELALDLRWSWNHSTHELWGRLDPELWELTQNPWVVLQTVSREQLRKVSADPSFQKRLAELQREKREAEQSQGWFQKTHGDSALSAVAYFSMEYMLSEALPIYSGGLGNVAGDQLKAASDLAAPVTAVGLLYQQGYFRQELDANGSQQALYPFNDPGQLPIRPLREQSGEWLRLEVVLPGTKLWIRTWQVQIGRRRLYLLDSNDPANPPAYRGITSELYGGGPEVRLKQEIILGVGGWRLLRALGLQPEVCHLNEGHAAFAVLERARAWMEDNKKPFDVAMAVTRAGNLFTTHTPVEAGFDRFAPELMERYLKRYAEHALGISFQDLLALGRQNPDNNGEPFNMAWLATRGSAYVNGVSRLHGKVSRQIFQVLFPRWPEPEVPVGHVTNGVHVPTWESDDANELWTRVCGTECWHGEMEKLEPNLRQVGDVDLWQLRRKARKALIEYTRERLTQQRGRQGKSPQDIAAAETIFDFDTLTMGFARRFAAYKRPNLLLHDPERLVRILTNPKRPVQLIIAGKAHPEDMAGQALIQEWNKFLRRPDVSSHVVFLSDYDMLLTQQLVQGVDVWINTPRRPWEASGTSGMKTLVNGGLNLSELDGWWAEAYTPDVGWAIGDGKEHGEDRAWDAAEAEALYGLLERDIVPLFYDRDQNGIPTAWVAKMRESMARLTPLFSAHRAVREYTETYYLPAAAAYRERAEENGRPGGEVLRWQQTLASHWRNLRFGTIQVETRDHDHVFVVQVYLDELDPDFVQVELFADIDTGGEPFRTPMTRSQPLAGSVGGYIYSARVPANRPAADYTPRVIPYKRGAFVPLEAAEILWNR